MAETKTKPVPDCMQRIYWESKASGWFDIEADATEEEITELVGDEAAAYIEWSWRRDGKDGSVA